MRWNNIPGHNPYYEVSDNGLVRSWMNSRHGKRDKPRLIKMHPDKRGYYRVSLMLNGKSKAFSVHRLVAIAFIPNPADKPQVNHIDGDKKNNNISNLEWCTQSENMRHAHENGLFNHKRGYESHNCASIPEISHEIKSKYSQGDISQRELAEQYGMSQKTVSNILRRLFY